MSVDLSQFHQVFFEESFEGLEVMESQLLGLQSGITDMEAVNTIFRAAHSIKGGAGTFGFSDVAHFTHSVETLLDEIRAGKRPVTEEYVDLFLQSVDVLRELLQALNNQESPSLDRAKELQGQLQRILENNTDCGTDINSDEEAGPENTDDDHGWLIDFKPHEDMLRSGNEPFRMMREICLLAGKDNVQILAQLGGLPDITSLDPEVCYIHWRIQVATAVAKDALLEVFEWVEDECDLEITPLVKENTDCVPSAVSLPETPPSEQSVAQEKPPVAPTEVASSKDGSARSRRSGDTSIRVSIDKVDSLINMVGELVITQSMLSQLGQDFDMSHLVRLQQGLMQLEQNTRELQESVMKIRMLPISFAFSRFPRLVRDLGGQLGKKVQLLMSGEETELDKTVMEKIGDPLVHLVRNSLDHGLELPQDRIANGKKDVGTIMLNAYHQGGNIVIEIQDDGAGLNEERILNKAIDRGLVPEQNNLSSEEIHQLIFLPGFSTADTVSDISGRGVGMDVVRRNIQELNGNIEVSSVAGKGSTFTIRLPLTLAILDGQLVRVGDEKYVIPLVSIVESIQLQAKDTSHIAGSQPVMPLRDEYIPIVCLSKVFGLRAQADLTDAMLVVVDGDSGKVGLVVDELLGQQQVVIKSLEQNYERVMGISGATILGDGTVALIIDVTGLHKRSEKAA
ncbi:chemotaxis protein CheA [Bacterioplanes sanyensis]|uniref:Chemotaxis protein CheA n=1 Tax=Bacterioplanes sanyensis TaxID=1249553 RepID=A0A222FPF0_9GAMM|nr:chemotaxis protein CheA [Bacterioplanes sanyensis]ASP40592.1 chemotaxis protein CheA [Bacterioplanes sanyensis]